MTDVSAQVTAGEKLFSAVKFTEFSQEWKSLIPINHNTTPIRPRRGCDTITQKKRTKLMPGHKPAEIYYYTYIIGALF